MAALYASTVKREPDTARKVLRDIGDGIGMYVERSEVAYAQLDAGERQARVSALLAAGRMRALSAGAVPSTTSEVADACG